MTEQDFSDYWIFKPFIENFSQEEKEDSFNTLYDYIKLCIHAKKTESIDKAIDLGLDINFKIHNTQFGLLRKAVMDGENKVVQYLCKHQIDINTVDSKKETMLHSIVKNLSYFLEDYSKEEDEVKNRIDILYTLFEYKINPLLKNEENNTALNTIEQLEEEKENSLIINQDTLDTLRSLIKNPIKTYQQKYVLEKQQNTTNHRKNILL